MTAGLEYRRLAGLLLLAALAPMPFLYIVLTPFWLVAGAAALVLLLAPARSVRLSPLAQNLIGLAIIVVVVAAGGVRVGPLRPLGHLLLLLTTVRASQVFDRRSFLRSVPLILMVWVVSLSASTHITVLGYFAISAALWWWAGMQILLMGVTPTRASVRPRHAVGAACAALLLAIPVFVVVPRLRSPWIAGGRGAHAVTGFSSRVELEGTGPIRTSQERALVMRSPSGRVIDPEWTRLRATAFERVTVGAWVPRPPKRESQPRTGLIAVAQPPPRAGEAVELEIVLERPVDFLFLPDGTLTVDVPAPVVADPAGGLVLTSAMDGPLTYTVRLTPGAAPPRRDQPPAAGLRFEPPAEVRALAERITAGLASDAERAAAVETYLQSNFTYSMAGMGRLGPDPMSWFLLRSRSGHCEYFAGGMVVLLDAVGVTARMVGGYSGGAASSDGAEVVVREANAHTWVEVWLGPELGWRTYDPTPAGNVPGLSTVGLQDRARFAWEWMQSSWDRYVLTFGLAEQLQLVALAGERITAPLLERRRELLLALLMAIPAATLIWWLGRRLRRSAARIGVAAGTPASRAVERLVRRLERSGVAVPPGATVRRIGRAATARWPATRQAVTDLELLAERELYARPPSPASGSEVRRIWKNLRRAMRE